MDDLQRLYNCTRKLAVPTPLGDVIVMWTMLLLVPIISILGVIGNILSFVILKDCSTKLSSFFYIRCLTIFDSLALIFTLFEFYTTSIVNPLMKQYRFYAYMNNVWIRWGVCQLMAYLAFSARTMSIWTIVIFTTDRALGIRFPMLSLKISTIRVAKIVVGLVVPISLICNITWIFSFDKKKSPCRSYTLCKNDKFMRVFGILDFVMMSIVPSIIILVLNCLIIQSLRERRNLNLIAYEAPKNKRRDKRISLQLLTVSFVFIILTLPSCISTILNSYHAMNNSKEYKKGVLADFYHISMLLFTVNLAINFALYCFVGKNFRYAAYSLIRCRVKEMRMYRNALFETQTDQKPGTLRTIPDKPNSNSDNENDNILKRNLSKRPLNPQKNTEL